jgi:cation transport ATPase
MQLTEEAQSSRPKLERWLDEFSERYSQAVVAASLAVAVFGPFLFKWPFLGSSGQRQYFYT